MGIAGLWENLLVNIPFQTELLLSDGSAIGINFVLACTALQSMVIFIGAIAVLDIDWRRRCQALLITVPVIHILNLFRNAGLIWMHMTYTEWSYLECPSLNLAMPMQHVSFLSEPCSLWLWSCLIYYQSCTNTLYDCYGLSGLCNQRKSPRLNHSF